MTRRWTRPRLPANEGTEADAPSGARWESFTEETPARAATDRPWLWFVAPGESEAREAASGWIASRGDLPVIAPPADEPLPIAIERLGPPGIEGERVLFVPNLERGFHDTLRGGVFSAASSLYLLPRLAQKAAEDEPLTFVVSSSEAALRSRGKDVLAQRGLASRFSIRRRSGDAEVSNEDEESRGDRADASVTELLALGLATRDPETRARAYERAVAMAPEDALVQLFLASSLGERGRAPDAAARLRRAVELSPGLVAAHYELGKISIRVDDMETALAAFRTAAELLPTYASAWSNLGAVLGETQDLDGALEALRRAVALDPMSHALHSNLGVAYRDRGELAEAERAFGRALALEPDFVFGHYNLAYVYFLQGRYPEAIETFEHARARDRGASPRQGLLLAATRLAAGDVEGALQDYREIFEGLSEPMRRDMRTVAEWDLRHLAERVGALPTIQEAASLLRSLA